MNVHVEAFPAFVITGMKRTFPVADSFLHIPKLWQEASSSGAMDTLYSLWARVDQRPPGILGISSKSLSEEGVMDYFLAVTTFVDLPDAVLPELPEGFDSFKFPAVDWAVCDANGTLPTAVSQCYREFASEWLPASGYIAAPLPIVECYIAEDRQQVWFPVVPRQA